MSDKDISKITKIPTIVPLVCLNVYDIGEEDEDKLFSTDILDLPSNTDDGIFFVRFSKKMLLSQSENLLEIDDAIKFPTPLGDIKFDKESCFPESHVSLYYNCAFVLNYYNKQEKGVCIFPNQIENMIIEPSMILKLFSPGNLFLPLAIVNIYGEQKINHNNVCSKNESPMSFSTCDLDKFKAFYIDYWTKLTKVKEKMQDQNKKMVSWAKRINNSIYFLNQTYFAKKANSSTQGARIGNELRLIYLITSLDALIGCDSSGKKLAENCHNAIGGLFPNIKKRILEYYSLRSNYIHANDEKMISSIKDTEIKELHHYIQKLILLNLRLMNSSSFVDSFQKSGLKHYFQHIVNINTQAYFIEIIEILKNSEDLY